MDRLAFVSVGKPRLQKRINAITCIDELRPSCESVDLTDNRSSSPSGGARSLPTLKTTPLRSMRTNEAPDQGGLTRYCYGLQRVRSCAFMLVENGLLRAIARACRWRIRRRLWLVRECM